MKWEKKTLNECCISIADGDHQAPPKADKGVPFITISNINADNKIDFSSCMFVTKEYYENLADKRKACKNDVLYSVVGSFGIPVFIDKDKEFVFQRHIAILRPDEKRIYPRFLYYSMKSRDFYNQADSVALGAAQRTISLTALKRMNIFVPPLETQNRIASILSAYDDLIENNQKQIKLLEEAAQRLYKEWFIDLRFPGYEDVKIVDGVPEGWKKSQLRNIGEIITGKTPSTSNTSFYGNEIPFVTIPDMHNEVFVLKTGKCLSVAGAESQKSKYIPKDSIMISCIGTVGLVCLSDKICQTNQQINSLVLFNKKDLYYVYHSLLNIESMLDGIGSNGTTMTNVNKEKFSNIELLIPSNIIICMYYDMCKPIFEKILGIRKQIYCLQEARDRLLPKLMSGEIEV